MFHLKESARRGIKNEHDFYNACICTCAIALGFGGAGAAGGGGLVMM